MDTRARLKEQRNEMFRNFGTSSVSGFIIGIILGLIMGLGAQNYSGIGLNTGSALIIIAFGLGMVSLLVFWRLNK
ncbi:MAG: hypothetical protein ABIJ12_03185 [bacterium]